MVVSVLHLVNVALGVREIGRLLKSSVLPAPDY